MLRIYSLLSFVALVLYLPRLLLKRGPENRAVYVKERLGLSRYEKADIWIHAVSVGEVIAALPFLKELKKQFPGVTCALSTTTYTGQKVARDKFPETDRLMYMPWDSGLCVRRAIRSVRPKVFIAVETELWPVLFDQLRKSGSSILVLNGRLSSASFRGYKRIGPFIRNILSPVDFFYMQGKEDAERIVLLGADPGKVGLMGNFKFDIDFGKDGPSPSWLERFDSRIFVAGSTHRGEDEIILDAFSMIRTSVPALKLIIAPRHPERFSEVGGILLKRNLNFARRTDLPHPGELPDIVLLDTVGELSHVYARADISFVGGSLLPLGGHNIMEPAFWGRPVLFGPYMDNFPVASEFIRQGAAAEVRDAEEMASAAAGILQDSEKARTMGQKAKAIVDSNTGAVKKALDLVRRYVGTP